MEMLTESRSKKIALAASSSFSPVVDNNCVLTNLARFDVVKLKKQQSFHASSTSICQEHASSSSSSASCARLQPSQHNRSSCRALHLLLTAALSCCLFSSASAICPDNYLNCGPHDLCLAPVFICDGELDCMSGADEKDCRGIAEQLGNVSCPDDHFSCRGSAYCLPDRWRCDGHIDCKYGDDEEGCSDMKNTKCEGFVCKSDSKCIAKSWVCDHQPDCNDGSDELNCPSSSKQHAQAAAAAACMREHGQFECVSGLCLPASKVCDGIKHCPQGEDEGCAQTLTNNGNMSAPQSAAACQAQRCTQGCFLTPVGPQCFCKSGYKLSADRRTCEDINECELHDDNHHFVHSLCTQMCRNEIGGYECRCSLGYTLSRLDNRTCWAEGHEPLLIYSDGDTVKALGVRSELQVEIAKDQKQAMGVDMLAESEQIFWTNTAPGHVGVYTANLNQEPSSGHLVLKHGLNTPEDIAVDWLAENIYISDSGVKKIIACHTYTGHCTTIMRNLDMPRALVLRPEVGVMYWTDWGIHPGIYSAFMDGRNKKTIIDRNIVWPNSLAYDETLERLYWADAKLEKIEFIDLVTNQRHILIDDSVFHPYSMSVFEDRIFWSDWLHYSLDSANKFTGHNFTQLVRDRKHIFGLKVIHPARQQVHRKPCWNSRCSHLCLMTENGRTGCACPDGMELSPKDHRTCIEKDVKARIFVSQAGIQEIYEMHIDNFGIDLIAPRFHSLPLGIHQIDDYAADIHRDRLFVYNALNGVIYSYNTTAYTWQVVVHNVTHNLRSLTFDPYSNALYYLDPQRGELHVAATDLSNHHRVLAHDLPGPVAFALDQERDGIFIACNDNNNALSGQSIIRTNLAGQNASVFVRNIGQARALAVNRDSERLFWADSAAGRIYSVLLNNATDRQLVGEHVGNVSSLLLYQQMVYWTDEDSDQLYFGEDTPEKTYYSYTALPMNVQPDPRLQLIENDHIADICYKSNCSFMCLFAGYMLPSENSTFALPTARCICPDGHEHDAHCDEPFKCPPGFFSCESDGQCLKMSDVCDGHKQCKDGEDEAHCAKLECGALQSRCDPNNATSECIENAWFCDGEADCEGGLDELHCDRNTTPMPILPQKNVCPQGSFACDKNRTCLNWHYVCDGILQCEDESDESAFCMQNCPCKNNGRCYMSGVTHKWECQCIPGFEGRDCEFKQGEQLKQKQQQSSATTITQSTKNQPSQSTTNITQARTASPELSIAVDDEPSSSTSMSFLVLIFFVLLVCIAGLAFILYYFETDGRLSRFGQRLKRDVSINFRSPLAKRHMDRTDARLNLLEAMEEDEDEDCSMPSKLHNI